MAKKKQTDREKIHKLRLATNRKNAMEQGAYDGRFAPKVFKDKKKEANKKASRGKVDLDE